MEGIRLNKYLAECGVCSRREADKLIDTGKVTVNGNVAAMGSRVKETDLVEVHGRQVKSKDSKVVLAFYKPQGITCTEKDKFAQKNIIEYIKYPIRITYAGRLDKDSEGLILLTNDGDLINGIMRASNYHEKEYVVKVKDTITEEFLVKMRNGVFLKDLGQTTRPCCVEKEGKFTFRIILTQGLNRQIRRMCKELGQEVIKIKRVRVMNIVLQGLKPGEYRMVSGEELNKLYEMAGK